MSRGRIGYALVLAAGAAFYVYYRGWLSWFVLLLLLLLPLVSLGLTLPAARRLGLQLRVEHPTAQKGDEVRFLAVFTNPSPLLAPRAECVLVLENSLGVAEKPRRCATAVPGRRTRRVEYMVSSDYAGRITCRVERARCRDFLGLFSFSLGAAQETYAYVLPRVVPLRPTLTQTALSPRPGDMTRPDRPGDDSAETIDLRPYRPGDPLRAVHWKLSGRTEELMVRQFAQRADCAVELVADLSGILEGRDVLLDALASLHQCLWDSGVGHRVTWFDRETGELTSRQISGEDDWPAVLRALLSPPGAAGGALRLRAAQGGGGRVLCLLAQLGPEERRLAASLENASVLVCAHGNADLPAGVTVLEGDTLERTLSALII